MSWIFEAKGLKYSYPDGTPALRGVDLRVREGECTVVIGPNGAGKSTLLLVLSGLVKAEGSLLYRGRTFQGLKDPKRFEIGILFQDPDSQLFSISVFEDVAFGPRQMGLSEREVVERVKEALSVVGLEGFEERSPHHLSFGERKRVALAAVLSMKPRVLLLDEPTSNLDPGGRRKFVELVKALEGVTKVIATHDLELAFELAERVIILFEGRVVKEGGVREVLFDSDLLSNYGLDPPLFVRCLKMLEERGEGERALELFRKAS